MAVLFSPTAEWLKLINYSHCASLLAFNRFWLVIASVLGDWPIIIVGVDGERGCAIIAVGVVGVRACPSVPLGEGDMEFVLKFEVYKIK